MGCYHPVPYYRRTDYRNDKPAGELPGGPVTIHGDVKLNPPIGTETGCLPCGKCIGCKAMRATAWAHRCMHEASLYENNRFLTLTYDDDHIPENNWLNLRDVQLWMKRLRKAIPTKLRYYLTGEYGAITKRPHYHALLFNCRFPDEKPAGKTMLLSDVALTLWGKGEVRIGTVTKASALYVAKYSLKATKGHPTSDGEAPPEPFATMSRGGQGTRLRGHRVPLAQTIRRGSEARIPDPRRPAGTDSKSVPQETRPSHDRAHRAHTAPQTPTASRKP